MGRILYVDDDRSNLVVFAAAFKELDVVTVESARDAIAVLERDPEIALVVTDQRMPGMSGTELAEHVKRRFPDVVRYLITAYADLDAAIEAINRGEVHRYLKKPWDAAELRIVLREGLELFGLRRRVRDLERRMREVERVYSLGIVAGSVVHELRNPMSVLIGFLELARMQVAGGDLERSLDGAWEAAVRMGEITRGVELTTRRQVGTAYGDLAEVAELTIKLVINELRHKATAMIDLSPPLPVAISPTRLGQVVLNLVINAIQAVAGGPDARIRITAARVGDRARLDVADNGPGVPDELKAKIFDPFFTTKADGGTGLGLAISRQIVEEGGGKLWVEDAPGGGAVFVAELPTS